MPNGYLGEAFVQHELIVNGHSYGLFDGEALEWGVESSSVDDPEDGNVPTGGRQTGSDLALERPWKSARDTPAYKALKAIRGYAQVTIPVHEVDENKQPVGSEPLDVLTGILGPVTKLAGKKGSNDTGTFKVTVQVKG